MAFNNTPPIANFDRHLSPGTVSPILYKKRPCFTRKGMYFVLYEYLFVTFYPDRLQPHNCHRVTTLQNSILDVNGYLMCHTPII